MYTLHNSLFSNLLVVAVLFPVYKNEDTARKGPEEDREKGGHWVEKGMPCCDGARAGGM